MLAITSASAADKQAGARIYKQQCAECHGARGQGVEGNFEEPLVGDRPVKGLALYIAKQMPEGEPEKCSGKDAEDVAAFMYDTFYSRAAHARINPLRVELARLTVAQYRNSLADLIGTFINNRPLDDKRGLQGNYFNAGKRIRGKPKLQRVDPTLDFTFGEKSPADDIKVEEFAIRWEGGVLVPESGEYEFIVQTVNGVKLWINEAEPLIDAWVRSGDQTEYRESIYLLGGRVYPVKVVPLPKLHCSS